VIARAEAAPAKINLTLRVLGRRPDGYHQIESLVAFARIADRVTLRPGPALTLSVTGPNAGSCGLLTDNLVLKAARLLADRLENIKLGQFTLTKRLPVAAGLGGGSSDAAAALRLLAKLNNLPLGDRNLMDAAKATGADVPVCLDPRARLMRGIGDILSSPIQIASLPAVLVNPGVMVATASVFESLRAAPYSPQPAVSLHPLLAQQDSGTGSPGMLTQEHRLALVTALAAERNDLEAPALKLAPEIADVLGELRKLATCRLARMSGSGATCFGLFDSRRTALAAARTLSAAHPSWWIKATMLADSLT